MEAALQALVVAIARGAKVHRDPNVSLTRTTRVVEDVRGDAMKVSEVTEDAFFWIVDGVVLVHPDRWDAFMTIMNEVERKLAELAR